jgi:hypothetical protein
LLENCVFYISGMYEFLHSQGQKLTQCHQGAMFALPPKADKQQMSWYVRFVPYAPNAPQQKAPLFDHLVGADEHARRHGNTERFRGL